MKQTRCRPALRFAVCAFLAMITLVPDRAGAQGGEWEGDDGPRGDGRGSHDGRDHDARDWGHEHGELRDPVRPMLRRIDGFMQRHEADGVVMDDRVVVNATEAVRLSVVSQLLAYTELYKVDPTPRLRRDITDRADFLIDRFDQVRSGSVFDGMLGYALLDAYDQTGEPRYFAYGEAVAQELKALPRGERILNGGLMGALALAKYYRLTGDGASLVFVDDCMASLPAFQHADGSFPHWCMCSTDIHYTDWMSTELILLRRMLDRPDIDPILGPMRTFMEGRIDRHGVTRYVDSCTTYPGCVIPYYSIASGCGFDYDTRAWTNELGYSALLFDRFDSPAYRRIMRFMRSLEHGGTFPDKWDFWPPMDDPYYVWAVADTSVINTSLIFWSLASIESGRRDHRPRPEVLIDEVAVDAVVTNPRAASALGAIRERGPGPRHRGTVDSLMVAGANPARFCDATVAAPNVAPDDRPAPSLPASDPLAGRTLPEGDRAPMRLEIAASAFAEGGGAIRFALPRAGSARLAIHDAGGRRIRELAAGWLGAGAHRTVWDGRDDAGRLCASGVYFIALRCGPESVGVRMAVAR